MSKVIPLKTKRRRTANPRQAEAMQQVGTPMQEAVQRRASLLAQAAMLEWFGELPITINRGYVDIAGGVLPALWLANAMEYAKHARPQDFEPDGDLIIDVPVGLCEERTGLTPGQQRANRAPVVARGLVSVISSGRASGRFRLHIDRIAEQLVERSKPLADMLGRVGHQDWA